ncbi:hypothetical protein [Massilia sp. CF038]|uniref:hypothetical protein n=1 Tax=Massilia sp. CF038 TaxID=1881045 RepID=UPI0015B4199D|nr:hypothetical protein [Massilia sp. CF038]
MAAQSGRRTLAPRQYAAPHSATHASGAPSARYRYPRQQCRLRAASPVRPGAVIHICGVFQGGVASAPNEHDDGAATRCVAHQCISIRSVAAGTWRAPSGEEAGSATSRLACRILASGCATPSIAFFASINVSNVSINVSINVSNSVSIYVGAHIRININADTNIIATGHGCPTFRIGAPSRQNRHVARFSVSG